MSTGERYQRCARSASAPSAVLEALEPRLLLATHLLVPEAYLDVGNQATYDVHISRMDGGAVSVDTTAAMNMTGPTNVAGYSAVARDIQVAMGGLYEKHYLVLTDDYLQLVKSEGGIDDDVLTVRNSNPHEVLPRAVSDSASNEFFGRGLFNGQGISDPSDTWQEDNTSHVTYEGQEDLTLRVNGQNQTFHCHRVQVRYQWNDITWGESGTDYRTFWIDYKVGIVKEHVRQTEAGATEREYELVLTSYVPANPPQPDLTILDLGGVAGTYDPGDTVHGQALIQNLGTADVTRTFYYEGRLSTDKSWDADDKICYQASATEGVDAGEAFWDSDFGTVPADMPAGSYYLGVMIDSTDAVGERNEDNNIVWTAGKDIVVENRPGGADLTISNLSVQPGPHSPGDTVRGEAVIGNIGDTDVTQTFYYEGRLSANAVWGDADDIICYQEDETDGVDAGRIFPDYDFGVVPANTPAGSYYLAVMIDSTDAVGELREDNNVAWTPSANVLISVDDAYEDNETRRRAYDLSGSEGTWLSSVLGAGVQADDDWYRIKVAAGSERVVVDCRFTHAEGDVDIALHDSRGRILDASVTYSDNEQIAHTVDRAGTYYLWVGGADKGNGYDLRWEDVAVEVPVKTHVLSVGVFDGPTSIAGDVAAQRMQAAFGELGSIQTNNLLQLNTNQGDNRDQLVSAIQDMTQYVSPGDTFVFYFASHGGHYLTGDEEPVDAQYDSDDLSARRTTTGDEYMHLSRVPGADYGITDDDLSELFISPTWQNVNKLFIIDTCYSGGHIGTTVTGDSGDLSRLNKVGIISASEERNFGWASLDTSIGYYVHILGNSMSQAIEAMKDQATISFEDLYREANVVGSVYDGGTGRVLDLEDNWTQDVLIDFVGFSKTASSDFAGVVGESVVLPLGGQLKAQFNDKDGDLVTVVLRGDGTGQVVLPADGSTDAGQIVLTGTTSRSTLSVAVRRAGAGNGMTTIGDIHVTGDLGSLVAKSTDVLGDVTITGLAKKVYLGDVADAHTIDIAGQVQPTSITVRDKVTLVFGRVAETSVNTHALPIASLTATEWLDADGNDMITAPWIGKLRTKGAKANAKTGTTGSDGDFQADLVLSGAGLAAGRPVLGSASIKGEIACLWDIEGPTGAIKADTTGATWVLDAEGAVKSVYTTNGLAGKMMALYFDKIYTKGDLTAAIETDDAHARSGKSIGTLTAGSVKDVSLNVPDGGIGAVTVTEWLNTDGVADTITAAWIGKLTTKGLRANPGRGIVGSDGDFQANLTLSGAGLVAGKSVLGSASIKGEIACLWDIEGPTGAIKADTTGATWVLDAEGAVRSVTGTNGLGGALTALYFGKIYTKGDLTAAITTDDAHARSGKSIGTLTAGSVKDVSLTVPGGIGAATVIDWLDTDAVDDTITAAWIGKLRTKGQRANPGRGIVGSDGDFQANLTLSGAGLVAGKSVLGSASIKGEIACLWDIEGPTGAIKADTTGATWVLDAEGAVRSVTGTNGLGGTLTALYFDKIYTKGDLTAAIETDDAHGRSGKSIGTLTAGSVKDVSLTVPGGIGRATVTEWLNTDAVDDVIAAAWIGKLTTKGQRANPSRGIVGSDGDFEANLTINGAGLAAGKNVLGSARVAGTWQVESCDIIGNVGAMTVGSMQGELLLGCDDLSGDEADFNKGHFTLRSLVVKGIEGRYFRSDSQLGAWEIGSLLFAGEEPAPSGMIEFHELPRARNVPQDIDGPGVGEYDLFRV